MQGLCTATAMRHADLSPAIVWDHFLNMGGSIGRFEVEAYLHGLMVLPADDRDCVSQAVNELLDDLAMFGSDSCCRAPYSSAGPAGVPTFRTCSATRRGRAVAAVEGIHRATGPAGHRVQQPSPQQPARRAVRQER
ncbi:hypothetical protein MN0502_32860 [Arthrobacter sp. MN05-02]|nr:hypothetical protein MN0502_32860 [Arthrobacter sp. MN05-02]